MKVYDLFVFNGIICSFSALAYIHTRVGLFFLFFGLTNLVISILFKSRDI